VTFSPTQEQYYGGDLNVVSNKTSGNNTKSISGTGIDCSPDTRIISLSGNTTFEDVCINSTDTTTLTISNSGNSTLKVIYPSGFSGNWDYGNIPAGDSQDVTVTFSPTQEQYYGGTLTVNSNATSGTNTKLISGKGIEGIYYVATDGNDSNLGTGISPWATLQHALNTPSEDEFKVIVRAGTYTEGGITFPENKKIILQGESGYQNTIVDGSGVTDSVFIIKYSLPGTTIEGLTIRGGNDIVDNGGGIDAYYSNLILNSCSINNNFSDDEGGGIYGNHSIFTLTNCTISNNIVDGPNDGGGIYGHDSTFTLTNCTISSNTASFGGGILVNNSTFTLTNCTISSNIADDRGGGIHTYNKSLLTLDNCNILNNEARYYGGGIDLEEPGDTQITNCEFRYNSSGNNGGGIRISFPVGNTITITDNIFCGNTSFLQSTVDNQIYPNDYPNNSFAAVCGDLTTPILSDPGDWLYPNQSYILEWTNVEGATQYRVKESTDPNDFSGDSGYVTSETSCDVVHSDTGTFYYIVRAENVSANPDQLSEWSNRVDMEVRTEPDPVVRRALLVGVGKYTYMPDYDRIRHILNVDRVSQTMNHWYFKPSYSQVNIETLTGYSATKSEILQKITDTFSAADQNDISYFWISTHGDYDSDIGAWLCPSDSLPGDGHTYDEWKNSRLFVDELEHALSHIPGGGIKVVLIDACYSGGFIGKNKAEENIFNPEEFNEEIISIFSTNEKALLTGSDYQVLTACGKEEPAYSPPGTDNEYSYFSKAFCDGTGYEWLYPADAGIPDYEITLNEAYQYTYDKVMELHAPDNDQHVQVYPVDSDFIIVEY